MTRSNGPRRVVLLIEAPTGFTTRLIRGVAAYSQLHGPWFVNLYEEKQSDMETVTGNLALADGIIIRTDSKKIHQRVMSSGIPIVNVGGTSLGDDVPWISVNNDSIVRIVFQEFRNHCQNDFAFFGPRRRAWGCDRENGFRRMVSESGLHFHGSYLTRLDAPATAVEQKQLVAWLHRLPKPIAIMAANDVCGHRLLCACHDAEIKVPEQVSVIGVNNDELICELSLPSLTSVSTNTERIGHKAAEILDALMKGETVDESKIRVEPLGIEPRRSTDQTSGVDPFVGLAFRFIQRHACDGINVEDVLKVVPLSRSSLEGAFRQFVGRSPLHEILRVRIAQATHLLSQSDLSVGDVARRCGYSTVEYFSVAFKREVGTSPSQYRREFRQGNS